MRTEIRRWLYKDKLFLLEEDVHAPDHYSQFLENSILIQAGESALDLVTGSGFHAIMMSDKASRVVGIDINPESVLCAQRNVLINRREQTVDIHLGDLYEPLDTNDKFDVIVALPPMFPAPPGKGGTDSRSLATEGGPDGRRIIDRIINGAQKYLARTGRLQILHAWYNNIPKSLDRLRQLGFEAEITAEDYYPVMDHELSFAGWGYLKEIGFPLMERQGKPIQYHAVVTATWRD